MSLESIVNDVIEREAGYVDHPHDRGGPTRWGITEQVARAWGYFGPMRDLPRQMAFDIYVERYWKQPRFDQVVPLSPRIAEELLDTGVNMGTSWPGRFLQRALNVLNQQERHYPDLAVDGVVGRMTLSALQAYLGRRGSDGEKVMLRLLNAQQAVRYIEIAERDPPQQSFMFGWVLHRVQM